MAKKSFAFVVPRYSASIGGGAETLMRDLAIKVKSQLDINVEIVTTCAKDNRTWSNYFTEGTTSEDGLSIHRFLVRERDIDAFVRLENKLYHGYNLTVDEQIAWIQNSINSTDMYRFIDDNKSRYDLLFFAPYLFGTTFWGSLLTEKSILVPCLHDEGYAYVPLMRTMFKRAKGIMWNSQPECELAERIYRIDNFRKKGFEVGMGFDSVTVSSQERFSPKTFFLYCGRKESGKGLDALLKHYSEYREVHKNAPPLVLTGAGSIDFLPRLPEGVIDLGFVTETQKLQLMKDAICLFQPSLNESFSIVIMEAWLQGTPVVVNSDCAVTKHHVEVSQGGLHYRSFLGFSDILNKLIGNETYASSLGERGRQHVLSYYSWENVLDRFEQALKHWLPLDE